MQVEQSAISKSQSSAYASSSKGQIMSGKFSVFDRIFPFFDQLTQFGKVPPLISWIFTIYTALQMSFISYWPLTNHWHGSPAKIHDIINYLTKIFFFSSINLKKVHTDTSSNESTHADESSFVLKQLIAFVVVLAVVVLIIISQNVYYRINYRFINWTLFISKIFFENVCLVMLLPVASFTGETLLMVCQENNATNWVFFFVGIILLLVFFVIYFVSSSLITNSSIIYASPMTVFHNEFFLLTVSINVILVVLSSLFLILPAWTLIVLQIVHLLIMLAFCLYVLDMLPFHRIQGNIIFVTVGATSVIVDILMVVTFFLDVSKTYDIIVLLSLPILFIVFLIVSFFLCNLMIKRAFKLFQNQADADCSEQEYFSIFNELNLHSNEAKALFYLERSFIDYKQFFLDWHLNRYIINHFPSSDRSLCQVIKILSYFPAEIRQLNILFNVCINRNDLRFDQRFLLYQVYHLKSIRQSSSSNETNERFNNLKKMDDNCIALVTGFWKSPEISISHFETLAQYENKVKSLWLEAIREFPNSSKFCEEYMRFCAECTTDFKKAIILKERCELIDLGRSFSVDVSFRSFVWSFPLYVKREIIDLKGIILKRANKDTRKGSSSNGGNQGTHSTSVGSSSSDSNDLSLTGENEIDAEVEQKIGKVLFTNSQLRLSLFHALDEKKNYTLITIPFIILFTIIICIAVFVGCYMDISNRYITRKSAMRMLTVASNARFYMDMATFALYMFYFQETGRMGNITENVGSQDELGKLSYISTLSEYSSQAVKIGEYASSQLNTLLTEIAHEAAIGISPYETAGPFVKPSVDFFVCKKGAPLNATSLTLKNSYTYNFYAQSEILGKNNISIWYKDDTFCQLVLNSYASIKSSNQLFKQISNYQVSHGAELEKKSNMIMIIGAVAIFIVSCIPVMVVSLFYVAEVSFVGDALCEYDKSVKAMTMSPILKNDPQTVDPQEVSVKMTKLVMYNVCLLFLALCNAIVFVIMYLFAINDSNSISKLIQWEYFSAVLMSETVECTSQVLQIIILNESDFSTFTNRESEMANIKENIESIDDHRFKLFMGSEGNPLYVGYDQELDSIIDKEECSVVEIKSLHDVYKCSSVSKLFSTYKDFINYIIKSPDEFKGMITKDEPSQLIHLLNSHFSYKLEMITNRCSELILIKYNEMMETAMFCMIIGILVSFVVVVFEFIMYRFSNRTFLAGLAELRRVPPLHLMNNQKIRQLLLGFKSDENSQSDSVARNILHKSSDGLLCTSINMVIEIVNPSVQSILGYTPDQLLGQSASILFRQKDSDLITKEVALMKEGQSSSVYEDHMICVSDSGSEVPCHTSILGMKNKGGIGSFVVIIRDETELVEQQKIAELAKQQSENLLYQILPRGIVIKINSGEKDISFSVPSASVMFIDVVKFSEYAANLSPQDIMGNLSVIFAGFDRICKKYELLTKIKLIGDIYMIAAGLFSKEDNPQEHANQLAHFGLEALTEMDDVNLKLNASLQIRIGMNTGGPLIAGVLGSDKPVFDIIGDVINVAARLQTTDIPGKLQIPQATYNLLSRSEYIMEPRGEVFLKGKGKAQTYLVSPGLPFASFDKSMTTEETTSDANRKSMILK